MNEIQNNKPTSRVAEMILGIMGRKYFWHLRWSVCHNGRWNRIRI